MITVRIQHDGITAVFECVSSRINASRFENTITHGSTAVFHTPTMACEVSIDHNGELTISNKDSVASMRDEGDIGFVYLALPDTVLMSIAHDEPVAVKSRPATVKRKIRYKKSSAEKANPRTK